MDREGHRFLHAACPEGQFWADQFRSLEEAWDECRNPLWMIWALDHLGRDTFHLRTMTCRELREAAGNPFHVNQYCFFCVPLRTLTGNEQRDSEIVGTLPRCAEHLREVGLEVAA